MTRERENKVAYSVLFKWLTEGDIFPLTPQYQEMLQKEDRQYLPAWHSGSKQSERSMQRILQRIRGPEPSASLQ